MRSLLSILVLTISFSSIAQWNTTGSNIHFTGGNVGIGTTSPDFKLDVERGGDTFIRLTSTDATYGSSLKLGPVVSNGRVESQLQYSGELGFISGGSYRMRILDSETQIHRYSSGVISRFAANANGGISGVRIQGKNNDGSDTRFLDIAFDAETYSYGFGAGSSSGALPISSGFEKADIVVDGNGSVGIGTLNPDQKLMVNGHISTTKTYNTKFQFVRHGWSGSHGILFNSYYNPTVNGNLAATGNTYYANSEGNHSSGAGAIMFFSNGGTMDFRISEKSEGIDQVIDWGTPKMRIKRNGHIGINTSDPDEMLTVNGTIHSTEVRVDLSVPGPDYVFEPTYDLKSLEEIEQYIKSEKHLPEIPSAKEMEANGVQLGEMNMLLLKKIEELTLHLIEKDKEINRIKVDHQIEINSILKRIEKLEN